MMVGRDGFVSTRVPLSNINSRFLMRSGLQTLGILGTVAELSKPGVCRGFFYFLGLERLVLEPKALVR
jgi:hypothetical protein